MDESGLLMALLVRRSWAPKGHPSMIEQKAGPREKVSIAAALWLPPSRDRLGMDCHTLVNGYSTNVEVAEFIGCAVEGLSGPVIAIWDRGTMHKGGPIGDLLERSRGRLDIEPLPTHAPKLTPLGQVWTWLKSDRLGNFAPEDARQLNEVAVGELEATRGDKTRLLGFFHGSEHPLPRALLTWGR